MKLALLQLVRCSWLLPILLSLMPLVSAQDFDVQFMNSSRVAGFGVYSRSCTYLGSRPITRLQWLLNGNEVESNSGTGTLPITRDNPGLSDAGEYHCQATFSDGSSVNVSGGFLNIFTLQSINAPSTQAVLVNTNFNLKCSSAIPGTSVLFRDTSDQPFPGLVSNATLSNQGEYGCLVIETSGGNRLYRATIHLLVVVPPTILHVPSVRDTYINEPETFSVSFLSSCEANTTVKWLLDNEHLSNNGVVITSYVDGNNTFGTTTLEFSELTRADRGRYSVTIINNIPLIPENLMMASINFRVDVYVAPAKPNILLPIESFSNDTRSRIMWNLTEHTVDAAPDGFIVNIENHPMSPVNVDPADRQLVIHTEPGGVYVITITAINVDSQTVSQPAHLILPDRAPFVNSLSALRLNETAFNFTLDVIYTGVGSGRGLALIDVQFRERSGNNWFHHGATIELTASQYSREIWCGVASNDNFAMIEDVEFFVSIKNTANLVTTMTAYQELVPPGSPEDVRVLDSSDHSLTLQARLSSVGTAPILATHFVISDPDGSLSSYNVTENLTPGGLVTQTIDGLMHTTAYSVLVYATNAAGRGDDSMLATFSTTPPTSVLPLWIILVIGIVGSLVVIILLLLLLISCCYKRHNNKKINITSPSPNYQECDRPGPLGAACSQESFQASSSFNYSQKGINRFVLDPAPASYFPPVSPTVTSNVAVDHPYSIVKPQFSITESETSDQSSKFNHFNFQHSPSFDKIEYSRSMPILDDPDLSPTMPPNCATDV